MMIGLVGSAQALTLKEKQKFAEWKTDLSDPKAFPNQRVNDKCGKAIPASLDEKMVTPFMAENKSPAGFCLEVVDGVSDMCGDATAKEAVLSKVKKVHCTLGKDAVEFKLSGSTLEAHLPTNASNISEKVKTFLGDHL
jgi:hypothetical protein